MTIKELRDKTGMTQRQFAERFRIPLGTYRDWEQGRAKTPAPVLFMIERILELESKVK